MWHKIVSVGSANRVFTITVTMPPSLQVSNQWSNVAFSYQLAYSIGHGTLISAHWNCLCLSSQSEKHLANLPATSAIGQLYCCLDAVGALLLLPYLRTHHSQPCLNITLTLFLKHDFDLQRQQQQNTINLLGTPIKRYADLQQSLTTLYVLATQTKSFQTHPCNSEFRDFCFDNILPDAVNIHFSLLQKLPDAFSQQYFIVLS